MEVELEVIGRHAMLFDDDATATFVNSKEALIEWNSLFIDRFDVRNLLSNLPRKVSSHGGLDLDGDLQSELDLERYADLPSCLEQETETARTEDTGYHSVAFSYGTSGDSTNQKNSDVGPDTSAFYPPFPVPESLLQNLPPTEKVHQIIARTALFVGEHGGQSEIVLRVKQGDNPTFGFLMPHHHLHPYFRYLVDHLQLLKADEDGKSQEVRTNEEQIGGALSLLGSVYGTGEDEDGAPDGVRESKQVESGEASAEAILSDKKITSTGSVVGKDEIVSKVAHSSKVKVPSLGKNFISSIKPPNLSNLKKDPGLFGPNGSVMEKPKASGLFPVSDVETLPVEPPSEMKRLIDRIVEIVLKNGKDFEAVLVEQNSKHGRFPFLLLSNQYHPYYLKVLKKAQESRLSVKSFNTEMDKNSAPKKDSDDSSLGSSVQDFPLDYDKKEKFKMVINKSKKDPQDQPSKDTQQPGITVDTAAAAAILQAATRGIKKPNLDIFTKATVSGASHGSSNEGGQGSSFGSLQSTAEKEIENQKPSVTIPVAKEIAKTAARSAAGEADSSEAGLTREQKLKAERLRRAKMFAAMIKSGAVPLGTEPKQTSYVESSECKVSGSATEVRDGDLKDREGSSGPTDVGTSTRIEVPLPMRISSDDIEREARKRRHYRSRKHDDSEEDEYEKREEDDEDDSDDRRHSRKKRRSHHSSHHHSDRSKDVHKHRRKHSSRSKESRHRHKHESSSSLEEDDRRSRYKHVISSDDEDRHHKQRYKHDNSSEDERKHRKRKHKHDKEDDDRRSRYKHVSSSDDEDRHHKQREKHDTSSEDEGKHRNRKHKHDREDEKRGRSRKGEKKSEKEVDLEEGEIITKSSDHSSSAIGDDTSTEASMDASKSSYQDKAASLPPRGTTEVPDELRAKIRAMLLATM